MEKSLFKDMWVYAELASGCISAGSLELCCEARKLCDLSFDRLVAVVVGEAPENEYEKLRECGVDRIITVKGTGYEYRICGLFLWMYSIGCHLDL